MSFLRDIYAHKDVQLHLLRMHELFERLETDENLGLGNDDVRLRLLANGKNIIKKPKYRTRVRKFGQNLIRGFMIIIWVAIICCFTLYIVEYYMDMDPTTEYLGIGGFLLFVVLLSAVLRYWQEFDDHQIFLAFKKLQPMYCTVLRNGQKQIVLCENLVLGDILYLKFGDTLGADARIIKSYGLQVDCVVLTADSESVALNPEGMHKDILHARNIAFACTSVVSGSGKAVVIGCGENSLVSRLADMSCGTKPPSTMRKHLNRINYFIYGIVVYLFICFCITLSVAKLNWNRIFRFMIGLIITSVPMFLATSTYFGLSLAARRLKNKNCHVQNLEAAETIGSTTVICTDMIGTMTQDRMRVVEVYVDNELIPVEDIYRRGLRDRESFRRLCRCATLCNNAAINLGVLGVPDFKKEMSGDTFDVVFLRFAQRNIESIEALRSQYVRIIDKPHTSFINFHLSVYRAERGSVDRTGKRYLLLMKGQRQLVLNRCTKIIINNQVIHMTPEIRKELNELSQSLWARGRRVFGLCELPYEHDPTEIVDGILHSETEEYHRSVKRMIFLGFLSSYDTPRPNISAAIAQCRRAGIKVVVFTKSHTNFAKAIAQQIGIISDLHTSVEKLETHFDIESMVENRRLGSAVVVDCKEMSGELERFYIEEILSTYSDVVFARVSQDQRYKIAHACQKLGAIVAVNGNSVLMSPTIRKADIGIAKGISSSSVGKSCADLVLLDDNFATIVAAIEEGRLLFQNMKKCIAFILSTNVPQILGFWSFLLFKMPVPLTVQAGLIIEVVVNLIPSISLFYEKPEGNLMRLMPKTEEDFLINRRMFFVVYFQIGVIEAAAAFLAYFIAMARNGFFPGDLIGIGEDWADITINDLTDSYGQEWTYEERKVLENQGGTAFFLALVMLQAVNLIAIKTTRSNLIKHGFHNHILNVAIIFMISASVGLCYLNIPDYTSLVPIVYDWWIYTVPCACFLFIFEMMRRYILRNFPDSWVEVETYY